MAMLAWGASSDAQRQTEAREEGEALGTLLRGTSSWAYLFRDQRFGVTPDESGLGVFALYAVTPEGPEAVALEDGFSVTSCEAKARQIAAGSRADGALCVPEAREDELWQGLAARTPG